MDLLQPLIPNKYQHPMYVFNSPPRPRRRFTHD